MQKLPLALKRGENVTYNDKKLKALHEKVERNKYLKSKVEILKKEVKELHPKLQLWKIYANNEQIDVDSLEGKTLTSFFYTLIGKKDEQLEKERSEAHEWKAKSESLERQINELNSMIADYEGELSTLEDCEREYILVLDEKLEFIKLSGEYDADHKLILREKTAHCEHQIYQIDEAISILSNVKNMIDEVLEELSSAEYWGKRDMFGGGKIADIKKYDHIENAKILITKIKKELVKLKSAVSDINISVDIDIGLEEFSSTSDWFFDNIFTASNVLDQIRASQDGIKDTLEQVKILLGTLENLKNKVISDLNAIQVEYEALK